MRRDYCPVLNANLHNSDQNRAVAGGDAALELGSTAADAFHMSAAGIDTRSIDAAGTVGGNDPAGDSSDEAITVTRGISGGTAAFCRINASSVICLPAQANSVSSETAHFSTR
jgi:hypothetical protein